MRRGLTGCDCGELAICECAVNEGLNCGIEPHNLLLAASEPDIATGGTAGQGLDLIPAVVTVQHRIDCVASVEAACALVGKADQTADRRPFAGDLACVLVTGAQQLVEHVYSARAVVVSHAHSKIDARHAL